MKIFAFLLLVSFPAYSQQFTKSEVQQVISDIDESLFCRMATYYGAERIKAFPNEVDISQVFKNHPVDKAQLAEGMSNFAKNFRVWYMVFATQLGIKEKDIENKEMKSLEYLKNTSTQELFHIYINCKPKVEQIAKKYKNSKYWLKK